MTQLASVALAGDPQSLAGCRRQDQLVVFMALARGTSRLRLGKQRSLHLQTAAWLNSDETWWLLVDIFYIFACGSVGEIQPLNCPKKKRLLLPFQRQPRRGTDLVGGKGGV